MLSEYKKQVVFIIKNAFFIIKNKKTIQNLVFFVFYIFLCTKQSFELFFTFFMVMATKLIATKLIATNLIATNLIATNLIATNLIATKLIATKLIATKLIATKLKVSKPGGTRTQLCAPTGSGPWPGCRTPSNEPLSCHCKPTEYSQNQSPLKKKKKSLQN